LSGTKCIASLRIIQGENGCFVTAEQHGPERRQELGPDDVGIESDEAEGVFISAGDVLWIALSQ
jgi:hypothetical protein